MKFKEKLQIVSKVWRAAVELVARYPRVLFPFILVGIMDGLLLTIIYMAPRPPFARFLAPIIRAFWGEGFLHYPTNFVLLPKIFQYAHIAMIGFAGVIMTGMAIGLIDQAVKGVKPAFFSSLKYAASRFFALATVWFSMFGLVSMTFRGTGFLINKMQAMGMFEGVITRQAVGEAAYWTNIFISMVVEVLFLYAIPSLILERKSIFGAFKKTFVLARKYFTATLVLVMCPSVLYLGIIFLRRNIGSLTSMFFPEVILYILGAGIVISVIIDFMVTTSGTLLFLMDKQGGWVLEGSKSPAERVNEAKTSGEAIYGTT